MTNQNEIILVWLDEKVFNEDNKRTISELEKFFPLFMQFVDQSECKRFLQRGVSNPRRLILITSGAVGEHFVPKIHNHPNILSIYVFCSWREKHETWSQNYSKVRNILQIQCTN